MSNWVSSSGERDQTAAMMMAGAAPHRGIAARRGLALWSGPWVVTFADVVLLLLTFSVMTYAMGTPRQDSWADLLRGLSTQAERPVTPPPQAGGPDKAISATPDAAGADLRYLHAVLDQMIEREPALAGVGTRLEDGRLVVSLPADLLFAQGSAALAASGHAAMAELGPLLARTGNRLAVAGHTDPALPAAVAPADRQTAPQPAAESAAWASNWDLSLARALAVARALRAAGLDQRPRLLGYADSRFPTAPAGATPDGTDTPPLPDPRWTAARRVDLLILPAADGER